MKEEKKKANINIPLPDTVRPSNLNLWGVSRYSNIKLRAKPEDNSEVLKYITQGSILELIKQSHSTFLFDGRNDYWYYARYNGLYGWIFGSYIDIYITKSEAEKKCEEILFSDDLENTE
ncbi:MAG: SH3 domain-containing protein [Spirochaetales bacterium]|nr:SH3 domain-containing protein [Spirochaetales bacterium]